MFICTVLCCTSKFYTTYKQPLHKTSQIAQGCGWNAPDVTNNLSYWSVINNNRNQIPTFEWSKCTEELITAATHNYWKCVLNMYTCPFTHTHTHTHAPLLLQLVWVGLGEKVATTWKCNMMVTATRSLTTSREVCPAAVCSPNNHHTAPCGTSIHPYGNLN